MEIPAEITNVTARYKKYIILIVILFVAALITYVVYKIVRAFKRPANATYVKGGGALPPGWDPEQITDRLFRVIDSTLPSTETLQEAFGEFNKLNDNQMIDVYNQWLKDQHDQEKKYYLYPLGSLTKAVKDKGIGYWAFGQNQQDLMILNLDRLKLP